MQPIHTWKSFISFGDTDLAQRIYFARIFDFGHRCMEDFALKKNIYADWFQNEKLATPVRHTEAEYLKSLIAGDQVEVRMFKERLGNTSFTLKYEVYKGDELAAKVLITHVTIDRKTGKSTEVPKLLKEVFNA